MQSVECWQCRAQSVEYRVQSVECRVQSVECSSSSRIHKFPLLHIRLRPITFYVGNYVYVLHICELNLWSSTLFCFFFPSFKCLRHFGQYFPNLNIDFLGRSYLMREFPLILNVCKILLCMIPNLGIHSPLSSRSVISIISFWALMHFHFDHIFSNEMLEDVNLYYTLLGGHIIYSYNTCFGKAWPFLVFAWMGLLFLLQLQSCQGFSHLYAILKMLYLNHNQFFSFLWPQRIVRWELHNWRSLIHCMFIQYSNLVKGIQTKSGSQLNINEWLMLRFSQKTLPST